MTVAGRRVGADQASDRFLPERLSGKRQILPGVNVFTVSPPNNLMTTIWRFATVLVAAILLCAARSGRTPVPKASDQVARPFSELDLLHNFGRVIEGTKVEH